MNGIIVSSLMFVLILGVSSNPLPEPEQSIGYMTQAINLPFQILCNIGHPWTPSEFTLTEVLGNTTGLDHVTSRYTQYGCHCGPYSTSGTVQDEVDGCCQTHKNCLRSALDKLFLGTVENVDDFLEAAYKFYYKFSCPNGETICHDSDFEGDLCECDKAMALCIAENQSSWNSEHQTPEQC